MKIGLFMLTAAVVILAGIVGVSHSAMCEMGGGHEHGAHEHEAAASSNNAQDAVDAGNKFCPVTGEPVDGSTSYVYEGKRYNFCCPMCIDSFKKDPKTYIKKIAQE